LASLQLTTKNCHPAFRPPYLLPPDDAWTFPQDHAISTTALSVELPCAALTQISSLKLSGLHVLLTAPQPDSSSSTTSTSQHMLPMLQQLELSECKMPLATLKQLQQATALTSLSLAPVNILQDGSTVNRVSWHLFAPAMQQLLEMLPLLTDLALEFGPLLDQPVDVCIKLFSARAEIQRLRGIKLPYFACSADNLATLPDNLTALTLTGRRRMDPLHGLQLEFNRFSLTAQTLEALPCVYTLQELCICTYWVDPAILPQFPRLRHLALRDSFLTPEMVGSDDPAGRRLQALLSNLLQLTQLRHLQLQDVRLALLATATFQPSNRRSATQH
jgi:hypothetical protein